MPHQLQQAIAALDAAIAELELQATSEQRLGALRKERSHLMTELNRKVQLRLRKVRRNSDEVLTRLATEYENCSKDQVMMAGPSLSLDPLTGEALLLSLSFSRFAMQCVSWIVLRPATSPTLTSCWQLSWKQAPPSWRECHASSRATAYAWTCSEWLLAARSALDIQCIDMW